MRGLHTINFIGRLVLICPNVLESLVESRGMHCGLLAIKVQHYTQCNCTVIFVQHTHTGDQLVFLDPHTTQQTVRPTDLSHIPDTSYHCNTPGYMNISDIDPSIALVNYYCSVLCVCVPTRPPIIACTCILVGLSLS